MLSTFMVNDQPDPVRFLKVAGDLIVEAAKVVKGEYDWLHQRLIPHNYS